ncbi:MAG: haloacid dehalogenase [Anaerolineaceae bacterium]|nr:haloacid dehalogenase [Anaerolineaceae bacterium]
MMDRFTQLSETVHSAFEVRNQARDKALMQTRKVIQHAAHAIRAIHRLELDVADGFLNDARQLVEQLRNDLGEHPDLFYAGYTQDALKEYVEAHVTCALIRGQELPLPEELDVAPNVYLNGLAEVVGELRRRCLDVMRQGYSEEVERMLNLMDEIYALLITIDYPDALTNGLRRQTDLARGIVERTRGDVTISLREQRLSQSMKELAILLKTEGLNDDLTPPDIEEED